MSNDVKQINVQDAFLNRLRKEQTPVSIHIVNGYQLNAVHILGYDNFALLVESDGREQLIYKHAISTITPLRHPERAGEADA